MRAHPRVASSPWHGQEGLDYVWVDKAKGLLKDADKPAEERYPYAIFTSARLLHYQLEYTTNLRNAEGGAFVNDAARFPAKNPIDFGVTYDTNEFKSKDKITSITTLLDEAVAKIVIGQVPLSEWDTTLQQWYKLGGTEYIDDLTAAFEAQKK